MPNERDISSKEYSLTPNKFRELKYFCKQYGEKKERLRSMCEISAVTYSDMPKGNRLGDRTASQAESRVQLANDLELIEQTAIQADSELYQYIIANVTQGTRYEHLDIPCSRSVFYRTRRKFFYLLALKK